MADVVRYVEKYAGLLQAYIYEVFIRVNNSLSLHLRLYKIWLLSAFLKENKCAIKFNIKEGIITCNILREHLTL